MRSNHIEIYLDSMSNDPYSFETSSDFSFNFGDYIDPRSCPSNMNYGSGNLIELLGADTAEGVLQIKQVVHCLGGDAAADNITKQTRLIVKVVPWDDID